MARIAQVFVDNQLAGHLVEDDFGAYTFTYIESYRVHPNARAASLTLPLRDQPFTSATLFPFFDGLIPEGWLLDLATRNWKVDPRDRMGLLLHTCSDCIGNVHILPLEGHQ